MSDLQCPARIFLLRPGAADVAVVVEQLRAERLVAVLEGEQDLTDVADRHRGEAVLVVTDHPHGRPLVLLEVDADGQRVTSWELPRGEVRQT